MALIDRVYKEVPGNIQERGRDYFRRGLVKVRQGNDQSVEATVQGSQRYDVKLTIKEKVLHAFCSCPYFMDNLEPCKHVWATIIAANTRGYLRDEGRSGPLRIDLDDDALDQYDGDSYEDQEYPEEWDGEPEPAYPRTWQAPAPPKPKKTRAPSWKQQLAGLQQSAHTTTYVEPRDAWPAGREILYIVDVPTSLTGNGLSLEVAFRERKKDGDWSKPKSQRIPLTQIPRLPEAADRQVLSLLTGARQQQSTWGYGYSYGYGYSDSAQARYQLTEPQYQALLPDICRTGRGRLRPTADNSELRTLQWDEGPPWEFRLQVSRDPSGKNYTVAGALHRGAEQLSLEAPVLLIAGGLVFSEDRAALLQDFGAFAWINLLRRGGTLSVPVGKGDELLQELFKLPHLPPLDLPEELRFQEESLPPHPCLKVKPPDKRSWGQQRLRGELSFDYGGQVIPAAHPGGAIYQSEPRRLIRRDRAAEAAAAERLRQLGFRPPSYYNKKGLELAPRNLPRVVRTLLEAGWHVEAEGKVYRQPGNFNIQVQSGIDWFELHGNVQFGDRTAALPELLTALKRGEDTVRLDDGTYGILPEEWLKKYGMLAGLGKADGDHLRFTRTQVGLLDALLAASPQASCDEVFARARDELCRFDGITPAEAPPGFVGELRGYQKDGLGWLYFLQRFGFGGCLADDMGLGKTVQVLALLEARRQLRATANGKKAERPGPSLVVVPRSLIFNWEQEAARFTPQLRVLDHTGIGRTPPGEHFQDYDLILTTYGTLRRDILRFKELTFDYCILDEAQAVKNASTESAKAVRLLRGNHRLVLSGTPVENHLGELWSLFEFLNPGMLGSASVLQLGGAGARKPDGDTRALLARALRPFILRRTKEQVAKDLPQKTEQTLYCELEPPQRKRYDELREHYRRVLLDRVEREGLNKSKIQVLEALLRLRQAACHLGLIDAVRTDESSAKLDVLLPQLAEVADEGHKALVFSQFTSLLAIVRDRLDKAGVPYEYLDGRTRNRAAKVERFQTDPDCKLFLVSLKAGGLGLNLTAAEYVFLLDPWWNPAVEAQAIDRAHRIGQTRPVFAYRLIARDTVEEKVLELQKTKRDLADAIINADNSLIRNLSQEDLRLLLS